MDLFNQDINQQSNLLPYEGEVVYYGPVFSHKQANFYYKSLMDNIQWEHDQAIVFGKRITTKRKVAWYGDKDFSYTYSKITKQALPWTEELLELKKIVEDSTQEKFNSCLLNLYQDGEQGMAWHSDAETSLRKNGAIGSLSFGAARKFSFKHKNTKLKVDVLLDHGSLLIMKGSTQTNWLHRLPPSKKVTKPRVNLTFRFIEMK